MENNYKTAAKCCADQGTCHPAGKKKTSCKRSACEEMTEPFLGKQGEWMTYKRCPTQRAALTGMLGLGYNKSIGPAVDEAMLRCISEHARELKAWAERFDFLERAYKAKLENLQAEYETSINQGYEEAYEVLKELQAAVSQKDQKIAELEAIIQKCCPGCCPEDGPCGGENECHNTHCDDDHHQAVS